MSTGRSLIARPVVRAILAPLLALLAYDVVVTVLFSGFGQTWVGVEALPMSLLGSAIGVLVGLRNTLAWARWWEARTLWGSIVNSSRSLARSAFTLLAGGSGWAYAFRLVELQIAWVHALRLSLLRCDLATELDRLLPGDVSERVRRATNVPFAIQREMGALLADARRAGALDSIGLAELNGLLTELANAQGGCERIKNTPMPPQFDRFPGILVVAYCILLPIGLAPDIGWFTPVGSAVVGFAFFGLDQAGRELAHPFDNKTADVPVHALSRTIEVDLRQALAEPLVTHH